MRDLFKNINIKLKKNKNMNITDFNPLVFINKKENNKNFKDTDTVERISEEFNKHYFKKMIDCLINGVTTKEFINIIKNDELGKFICKEDNSNTFKFNHDYYNKWKLKNKIEDF